MKKTVITLSIITIIVLGGLGMLHFVNPTASEDLIRPIIALQKKNQTPEARLEDIKKYIAASHEEKTKESQTLFDILLTKGLMKEKGLMTFEKELIQMATNGDNKGLEKINITYDFEGLFDNSDAWKPKVDLKTSIDSTFTFNENTKNVENPSKAAVSFDMIAIGEQAFVLLKDLQTNIPELPKSITDLEKAGMSLQNQWIEITNTGDLQTAAHPANPEKIKEIMEESWNKNFANAKSFQEPISSVKNEEWFVYTYELKPQEAEKLMKGFINDIAGPLSKELYPGDQDTMIQIQKELEKNILQAGNRLNLNSIISSTFVFKSHITDFEKWALSGNLVNNDNMMLSLNVESTDYYKGSLKAGITSDEETLQQEIASLDWMQKDNIFELKGSQGRMVGIFTFENEAEAKKANLTLNGQELFTMTATQNESEYWDLNGQIISGNQPIAKMVWNQDDKSFVGKVSMITPFGENTLQLDGTTKDESFDAEIALLIGENKESLANITLKEKDDSWSGEMNIQPGIRVQIERGNLEQNNNDFDWDINITAFAEQTELMHLESIGSWEEKNTINISKPLKVKSLETFINESQGGNFNFMPISEEALKSEDPYYTPEDINALLNEIKTQGIEVE